MKFRIRKLEALKAELAALPAPDDADREVGKPEAVRLLGETILDLLRRGFRLESISALLSEREVPITKATLARYIRLSKGRGRKGARPRGKPDEAQPRPTSGESAAPPATRPGTAAVRPGGRPVDKASTSPLRKPDATQAAFTPRPDTDDI